MIQAYIISIIAIFLAFLARYERMRYALPLAFGVITAFLSLGYEWGNDVATYFSWFEGYNQYSLFDSQSYEGHDLKSEFGWVLINQLCAPIGFYGMRAVLFAFENLVIYMLIKRVVSKEYYWFAVFIYTMNPNFMVLSSSMMRQWLAMCLVVLGFLYLEKRKWVTYIALVLVAFSIHKSSLICLPLVLLPRWMDNIRISSLSLLIPILLIYYLLSGLVVDYVAGWLLATDIYTSYSDVDTYSSGVGFLSIVQLVIIIYMFVNIQQIEKHKRIYIAVLIAFSLILPLYNYSGLASRLSFYFVVFTIAAYPLFLNQSKANNIVKYSFIAVIIVITIYNNFMFFADPTWLLYFGKYTTLIEAGIINF